MYSYFNDTKGGCWALFQVLSIYRIYIMSCQQIRGDYSRINQTPTPLKFKIRFICTFISPHLAGVLNNFGMNMLTIRKIFFLIKCRNIHNEGSKEQKKWKDEYIFCIKYW